MSEKEWYKKLIDNEDALRKENLEMRIIDFKRKLQELNKELASANNTEANEIRMEKEKAINKITSLYNSLISEKFELDEEQINEYNYYKTLSESMNREKGKNGEEQSK